MTSHLPLGSVPFQRDPPRDWEDKSADVCTKCFSKYLSNGVLGIFLFLFESG